MPKPAVPPKCVNGKDMADNSENEVSMQYCIVCDVFTTVEVTGMTEDTGTNINITIIFALHGMPARSADS